MTHTIKLLQSGDEALLVQGVDLTDEGPVSTTKARAFLADRSMVNVVAVDDGRVVGFLYGYVLRRFEADSLFIYSVDVDEAFQRRGIALAMLQALDASGRSGAWDEMFVFTNASNDPAMALYKKAGGIRPHSDDVMFDFFCAKDGP